MIAPPVDRTLECLSRSFLQGDQRQDQLWTVLPCVRAGFIYGQYLGKVGRWPIQAPSFVQPLLVGCRGLG